VSAVLAKLLGERVLSVPIYAANFHAWIGHVSIWDIVRFALISLEKNLTSVGSGSATFGDTPISTVMTWVRETQSLVLIDDSTPMGQLAKLLSYGQRRGLVHLSSTPGAPPTDTLLPAADPTAYRVVSQTDVCRFLVSQMSTGAIDWLNDKVGDLYPWLQFAAPITVKRSDTLGTALGRVSAAGVSALPVVDDKGCLVDVLSTSDCAHISKESFASSTSFLRCLEQQVGHFLGSVPRRTANAAPITATLDDTLLVALNRMLDHHIHRVVLVDAASHPIGVLSLTDVTRVTAKHYISEYYS
jgi:CBS domain-containing protein